MLPLTSATLRKQVPVALGIAVAAILATLAFVAPATASVTTQLQTARDNLANCQILADRGPTQAQRQRGQQCAADWQFVIGQLTRATPTPSSSPTASPTSSPTVAPTTPPVTTPPVTPSPTTQPPVSACAAWPAVPDAACTGYLPTGVTLHTCPGTISSPGTYDSCRFTSGLTIASTGVTVSRSLVNGHVEGVLGADLRGAVFRQVEIIGEAGDGSAAIGNNNYTCDRCNIHAGNRGFALGSHVRIMDSYAHDFWVQPASQQGPNSAHQSAISTHGGSDIQVLHSNLRCNSDAYACSGGFQFYSEDPPGISNVLVRNNRITADAGYGMMFGTLIAGKPYGITGTSIIDNVIDSSEYGPVANWPANQSGNTFTGNHDLAGALISP